MRAPAVLLASLVLLTGCRASTPPVSEPTSSATTEPSLSPSPTPQQAVRAVRAAVVADERLFLYEVAGDQLSELARGGGLFQPRWLSATEVAAGQRGNQVSTVVAVDVRSRSNRQLVQVEGSLLAFDVSRDGNAVATMSVADGFARVELHYLVGDRAVRRLTTMPVEARGGSIDDQFLVEFSPNGERVLVVNTANPGGTRDTAGLQVWRVTGAIEYWVDADRGPTAATWLSTGGIVFRSRDGVRRWRPGASSSVGVGNLSAWFSPWPSPNGRLVVFDTGRTTRSVRVRRIQLSSGQVVEIGPEGRGHPVFAAGNEVWTQIVQRCQPDCLEPFVLGPVVYATNPKTGTERELSLPTLVGIDIWYE